MYDFISLLWIVGPIPSRKVMNAIKFCVSNYRAQLLEGDGVCLLSQSHVGKTMLLKSLNGTPLSISERERQREKSLSADQSY